MTKCEGKVAFVTGGVSGIGLGIARAFVAEGMKVVLTYRRATHLDEALRYFDVMRGNVHAIQLDVTDRSAVASAADEAERRFGRVDVLCNNAGVNLFGPMDNGTYEDWDWILGVNLGGTVNTLVTFLPRLKRNGPGGHVINVASMSAMLGGPNSGIYATSKFAILGLSESLRFCLSPYRIGVSVFCPGLVNSHIYESDLNRPEHLANSGFRNQRRDNEQWRRRQARGMDPLEAGRLVLQGIQRNDFYIFSHPRFKRKLRQHFDRILAAFPEESHIHY